MMSESTTIKFYALTETTLEVNETSIMTAALWNCGLCGRAIDGMGGPGHGTICKPCGDALKQGKLVGCVKWSEADE